MKMKRKKSVQIYYYFMILPAAILVFLFNTATWPGLVIAFQKYIPSLGLFGSKWVGLKNIEIFVMQPNAWQIIRNTLVIAIGKIVSVELVAIIFALMLNEVRSQRLKKVIQTAVYLPHFISWVIYATILKAFIGTDGLFNAILNAWGLEDFAFLGTPSIFPLILVLTQVIKEFGFGAIIYISAIAGVDPELYEAAQIDGASRWKQTLHVTLPGISYIIVLSSVLSLGSILNAGFDQVFNLYNTLVMSTGDILDTWIYRQGFVSLNYGVGTAVGLCKGLIAMVLTVIAYWAADKFADYRIF